MRASRLAISLSLIGLVAVLVLVAAALGQFRWDQFTWF